MGIVSSSPAAIRTRVITYERQSAFIHVKTSSLEQQQESANIVRTGRRSARCQDMWRPYQCARVSVAGRPLGVLQHLCLGRRGPGARQTSSIPVQTPANTNSGILISAARRRHHRLSDTRVASWRRKPEERRRPVFALVRRRCRRVYRPFTSVATSTNASYIASVIGELPKLCVKIRPDSWLVCGPFRCHREWRHEWQHGGLSRII